MIIFRHSKEQTGYVVFYDAMENIGGRETRSYLLCSECAVDRNKPCVVTEDMSKRLKLKCDYCGGLITTSVRKES